MAHTEERMGKNETEDVKMNIAVERRNSLCGHCHLRPDIGPSAPGEIGDELTTLLADVLTLYLKTKNFHWHMSGRHFRDYHVMMDEQADQMIAMTDAIAERVRKIGGRAIRINRRGCPPAAA